jgi:tryptophan synthase alpha chain
VTGATAAHDPFDAASDAARSLRASLSLPVVVGFGIDDADKARRAGRGADGIVVGSAIVKAIESARGDVDLAVKNAVDVITEIRRGLAR